MHKIIAKMKEMGASLSFATAGGGHELVNRIIAENRASEALCHATTLYSKESVDDFIDSTPEKYVSAPVALELALESSMRNLKRFGPEKKVVIVAVGVTATMAYEGQREDRINQAFVAILVDSTVGITNEYQIVFTTKTRAEQEQELGDFITDKLVNL